MLAKLSLGDVPRILNNNEIIHLCELGMIKPFEKEKVREVESIAALSFGAGHFGYDIRGGRLWKSYRYPKEGEENLPTIDPKNPCPALMESLPVTEDGTGAFVVLPPHGYALCNSIEEFNIPEDVVGIALGKSTNARAGLLVNITPLEPGWQGHLTIEVANVAPLPIKIYCGEGIAQITFHLGKSPSGTYSGKYQNQAAEPVLGSV